MIGRVRQFGAKLRIDLCDGIVEIREPTAEEKAQPFVILEGEAVAALDMPPGRAGMRVIRAVCTIEGMNRVTGQAMIKDPMGRYHVIDNVPAARFENITLGTTVIVTYSEAVALALEKSPSEME